MSANDSHDEDFLSNPKSPLLDGFVDVNHDLRDAVANITEAAALCKPSWDTSTSPRWEPNSSIVLLGIRGTGKTSLAILASSCIGFRVVDADQHFYQRTGLLRAAYVSKYGFEDYRKKELSLMQSLLCENPFRCIIACGPGSAEGTGQELLKAFEENHPIIYILRDPEEVDQYLQTNDPVKISKLAELASPSYRKVSNFEFYNLSETHAREALQSPPLSEGQAQPHPYLTLKNVEEDFLRLILSIRSQNSRPRALQPRHSLSFLPPEAKPFTYAMTVPIKCCKHVAKQLNGKDIVADAIELAVDLRSLLPNRRPFDHNIATYITKQYYILRRHFQLPIIFHVQPANEKDTLPAVGYSDETNDWPRYAEVLSHGLRLAPEYMTLDLRMDPTLVQSFFARNMSVKIIGNFFDGSPGYDAWESPSRLELVRKARNWGCDLARISQKATCKADNLAIPVFLHHVRSAGLGHLPLIAYNLGYDGRSSQFSNNILSPVTHDSLRQSDSENHVLTVQDAQKALYASFTLDKLVFGILGSDVTTALSPLMQNAAFEFCGMPHEYRTFQSSSLRHLEVITQDRNFGGASITSPFKKEIISVLDYLSPEALAIGAVNTVVPLRSGKLESLVHRNQAGPVVALFGDNTDWIGLHTSIQQNLSPINAVKSRTTAVIIGAGGMAQAAVYAVIRLGVKNILIYNRTIERAHDLVSQFSGRSFSLRNIDLVKDRSHTSPSANSGTSTPAQQKAGPATIRTIKSLDEAWPLDLDYPTIIVSCIKRVSENGQAITINQIPETWLRSPTGGVAVELSYDPIDTPLLQQIRALRQKGWIDVHGLQVLPEQGIAQFELFTGRTAPQHLMRKKIAEHFEILRRQVVQGTADSESQESDNVI